MTLPRRKRWNAAVDLDGRAGGDLTTAEKFAVYSPIRCLGMKPVCGHRMLDQGSFIFIDIPLS